MLTLLSTLPLFSGKETVSFQTTGAAIAQYSAAQYGNSASICAGATTVEQLLIRNQGTVADTYYIAITSDDPLSSYSSSFISVDQEGITLQPGEEKTVFYYITPQNDDLGPFTYTLTITSLYSDTKTIEQTTTVEACPNIALSAYNTYQQTCPCSVGVYVFDLANSGSSTETYDLWLADMDLAYYDLSEYQVTLAPGEHKDIYAYLRMACSIYGAYSFTLVAETAQSGYTAELPLALDVLQACYVYNIALGEPLIFSSDAPMMVTFTPKADTTYVLCQEDPAVIPVNIQNTGDITNEYHVFIEDAEDWISAAEPYIKLKGNQDHTTSLVVNSVAAPVGTYSFALKANTLRGDLESVIPFTVEIQQCTPTEGLPTWLKWTLVTLLGAVLLAILVVAYFLYTKKGAQKKGKGGKEHPLITWAGKHKHLLGALLGLFLLLLLVGILAYPIVKEKYDARVAAGSSASEEARTVPTLFYNWATALIVLGILLLLAFLVWYFKFRKKQKKSSKTTKESRAAGLWNSFWNTTTWEKVKPFLKWLWIIFLLLLLLGGLTAGMYFLYNNYKEDANKFLTEQNATSEEQEEPALEETETSPETAALEEQMRLLQEQIASLEEKLFALSEAAAQEESDDQQDLLDQITALEEQIAALEKQLQELLDKQTTEQSEEDTTSQDLEDRIDALEEQIKALQALIATLSLEQNQETQEVVEQVQEEIDSLEEEKEQLEEQQTEEEIVVPEITSNTFKTILAFDVSLSGQIVESGKTRFERGIIAAQTYIQEKGTYSVMIVGKNSIVIRRDVDSGTALKVIKNLRPLDTQSNLGKALYTAAEQLNGAEGRIVLISDMQTTDNTDIYKIKKELEKQGIDIVFLNLSQKKSIVQPVETSDEETAPQEEAEQEEPVQAGPVFDTESQTAGDFTISIPKNAVYPLDLEQYFSDADNDALVYTATAGEHLTALVEGAIALLTPEQDWIGETTLRFAADDGKGGVVESPLFKVVVAEQEPASVAAEQETAEETIPQEDLNVAEQEEVAQELPTEETEGAAQANSYVPWIILGSIIFLIILSLVMGAFVKKFHNDPHAPEHKDEEKKE